MTERSDRPISRWISCVRPPTLPARASRVVRVDVARGSMPYSAVTQPLPVPRRNGGTRSSTDAVQMTRVRPDLDQHRAFGVQQEVGREGVGRSSSGQRQSRRVVSLLSRGPASGATLGMAH